LVGISAFINEGTLWPNHPVRFFSALSLEKTPPPIRPEVMVLAQVMFRCRTGFLYRTAEMLSEKYVEWTNDMAGGPTRTSWLCHGERRHSRHVVKTSLKDAVTVA